MNKKESVFVISDVHGCYKTLKALIKRLPKDAKICFVGDIIDRGPSSKKVIEFIKDCNYDCVLGNHEHFLIDSMKHIFKDQTLYNKSKWIHRWGGKETLDSYGGIKTLKNDKTFLKHLEWLKSLPYFIEYKNVQTKSKRYLVVTHAPVNDMWRYRNHKKDSINYLNFIDEIQTSRSIGEYDNKDIFNVFGHTPISEPKIKSFYAAIDLGCVYGKDNQDGYLCALEFPSMKIIKQKYIE